MGEPTYKMRRAAIRAINAHGKPEAFDEDEPRLAFFRAALTLAKGESK